MTISPLSPYTRDFDLLLEVAEALGQRKYVLAPFAHCDESAVLGAFVDGRCVGFLRLLIQRIGSDEDRPPILREGVSLREGYVEAFGVLPAWRRKGIGQQMQERAIAFCKERTCYQIRSRSPLTSPENYALKIKMGYAIQPSNENDSYYFLKTL